MERSGVWGRELVLLSVSLQGVCFLFLSFCGQGPYFCLVSLPLGWFVDMSLVLICSFWNESWYKKKKKRRKRNCLAAVQDAIMQHLGNSS